jgi:short-subunit dehydrogenase
MTMGSLSSLVAVPGLAVYGATKHAVLGFTASLEGS